MTTLESTASAKTLPELAAGVKPLPEPPGHCGILYEIHIELERIDTLHTVYLNAIKSETEAEKRAESFKSTDAYSKYAMEYSDAIFVRKRARSAYDELKTRLHANVLTTFNHITSSNPGNMTQSRLVHVCGKTVDTWPSGLDFIAWFSQTLSNTARLITQHYPDMAEHITKTMEGKDPTNIFSVALDSFALRPTAGFINMHDRIIKKEASSDDEVVILSYKNRDTSSTRELGEGPAANKDLESPLRASRSSSKKREKHVEPDTSNKSTTESTVTTSKRKSSKNARPLPVDISNATITLEFFNNQVLRFKNANRQGSLPVDTVTFLTDMWTQKTFSGRKVPATTLAVYLKWTLTRQELIDKCKKRGLSISSKANVTDLTMAIAKDILEHDGIMDDKQAQEFKRRNKKDQLDAETEALGEGRTETLPSSPRASTEMEIEREEVPRKKSSDKKKDKKKRKRDSSDSYSTDPDIERPKKKSRRSDAQKAPRETQRTRSPRQRLQSEIQNLSDEGSRSPVYNPPVERSPAAAKRDAEDSRTSPAGKSLRLLYAQKLPPSPIASQAFGEVIPTAADGYIYHQFVNGTTASFRALYEFTPESANIFNEFDNALSIPGPLSTCIVDVPYYRLFRHFWDGIFENRANCALKMDGGEPLPIARLVDGLLASVQDSGVNALSGWIFSPCNIQDVCGPENNPNVYRGITCIRTTKLSEYLVYTHDLIHPNCSPGLLENTGITGNTNFAFLQKLLTIATRPHICSYAADMSHAPCKGEEGGCDYQRLIYILASGLTLQAFSAKQKNPITIIQTLGIAPCYQNPKYAPPIKPQVQLPNNMFNDYLTMIIPDSCTFIGDDQPTIQNNFIACPLRCGQSFSTLMDYIIHLGFKDLANISIAQFVPRPVCSMLAPEHLQRLLADLRFVFTLSLLKIMLNFYKAMQDSLLDTAQKFGKHEDGAFADFTNSILLPCQSVEDVQCLRFLSPLVNSRPANQPPLDSSVLEAFYTKLAILSHPTNSQIANL